MALPGTAAPRRRPAAPARPRQRADRLSPARRTAAILDSAREIFRQKGFHDASVTDIAGAIGVVEGTIYRYFPTKRDLLIAVVSDWYERILADYDRQLKAFTTARDQLRFMVWRHLELIHRDPDMCRLVFGELRAGADYRGTAVFDLNRAYTRRTLEIVKAAIARGEFRAEVSLSIVRDLLFGCVEHHSFAYLRGEGDFSPDVAADAIVDIVYRGLVAERPRRDPADDLLQRLGAVVERLERSGTPIPETPTPETPAPETQATPPRRGRKPAR